MSAYCETCGHVLAPRYKLEPPSGPEWSAFLSAWLLQHGAKPVPLQTLLTLARSHGAIHEGPSAAIAFGHMLGLLSKNDLGPEGYRPKQHAHSKGTKRPSKWRLVRTPQ
jgi:hypothetical protein